MAVPAEEVAAGDEAIVASAEMGERAPAAGVIDAAVRTMPVKEVRRLTTAWGAWGVVSDTEEANQRPPGPLGEAYPRNLVGADGETMDPEAPAGGCPAVSVAGSDV